MKSLFERLKEIVFKNTNRNSEGFFSGNETSTKEPECNEKTDSINEEK